MLTGFFGGTIFLLLTPPPPDGQTRRGLDGTQANPRHQHARSRRARESVHGECTLPRSPPHYPHHTGGWQVGVSPCRSTGSRSPSSWTSWWRCRMSQPTLCSRCSPRSRPSSEGYVCVSSAIFLLFFCADFCYEQTTCFFFFFVTDLGNIHEMLQLPSERQHYQAGCRLVHTLFWVGSFFCFLKKKITSPLERHSHPFSTLSSQTFVTLNGTSLSHHSAPH